IIIASNDPQRTFTYADHDRFLGNLIKEKRALVSKCHRCHAEGVDGREADMMAFAPLSFAPWGVTVRQPESVVFGPSTDLQKAFAIVSLIVIAVAVILSIGLSRSIISPLRALGRASERIASGDLTAPVPVYAADEVGELAESLEAMRVRLKDSLEYIRLHTVELEDTVKERTSELRKQKKQLSLLLDEDIRAQEEERKRIARELHDETSQTLAALGMSLELSSEALRKNKLTPEMILELKNKVSVLMDGINRLIHDLRPPVLDDLGLESAIRWLLQRHLGQKGVTYDLRSSGMEEIEMDGKVELSFFRIVQESVINIVKHSKARNVMMELSVSGGLVNLDITDDGVGFNLDEVMKAREKGAELGFGLMGIKERVSNLGGEAHIFTEPDKGTKIKISIPAYGGP
ncbi:hypothetical protein LCGC14_2171410, partial [marine sediment metagenome]